MKHVTRIGIALAAFLVFWATLLAASEPGSFHTFVLWVRLSFHFFLRRLPAHARSHGAPRGTERYRSRGEGVGARGSRRAAPGARRREWRDRAELRAEQSGEGGGCRGGEVGERWRGRSGRAAMGRGWSGIARWARESRPRAPLSFRPAQLPFLLVVALGVYLLGALVYGVATFRSVPEEAESLQRVRPRTGRERGERGERAAESGGRPASEAERAIARGARRRGGETRLASRCVCGRGRGGGGGETEDERPIIKEGGGGIFLF